MRRNLPSVATATIILLALLTALLTPLLTPVAKADIYSGSAQSFPPTPSAGAGKACNAYLVVDTGAWTVNLRWDGPSVVGMPQPELYTTDGSWWSLWDDEGFAREQEFMPRRGEVTFPYLNSHTWVHAEVQWTYVRTTPQPSSFQTKARVDVYVANDGGVSFSLREHAAFRPSYSPDVRFLKPSSGVLRIDSYQSGTISMGYGAVFAVVPRNLINGKYIRFNWSGYFSFYEPREGIARAWIYDGEYDRANDADFPEGFPEGTWIPIKGAGLLQTFAVKTASGNWGPETVDALVDVAAGTQSKCTIFFLMGDGWIQQTVYLDLDWFEINEGAGGSGRLTLENFDAAVTMERTGTYWDYGYLEP